MPKNNQCNNQWLTVILNSVDTMQSDPDMAQTQSQKHNFTLLQCHIIILNNIDYVMRGWDKR